MIGAAIGVDVAGAGPGATLQTASGAGIAAPIATVGVLGAAGQQLGDAAWAPLGSGITKTIAALAELAARRTVAHTDRAEPLDPIAKAARALVVLVAGSAVASGDASARCLVAGSGAALRVVAAGRALGAAGSAELRRRVADP